MAAVSPRAIGCPVCGAPTAVAFRVRGHDIRRCAGCSHRFSAVETGTGADHVRSVYGDHYFTGEGAGYPDYLADGELLRERGRGYARLIAGATTPGRVLDIGAAAGFVLQGLCDEGWRGAGIEPNATMAAHARERLGLDVRTGTLEQATGSPTEDLPAPVDGFDLITMIQVVAHFHDLREALARAQALTAPGGHWLIETWDSASLSARLLGRHWHECNPPSVLHQFSRASLVSLAAQFGMTPVRSGRPARRISGAHAKSLLRHQLGTGALGRLASAALAVVPDRVSLPYPADDLFWILLRKDSRAGR
ncbi:MAG: class I SAM-dependent methyltransferase [Burkholderiales bacterium]|nr:class I SAM-dependent methyltransferase [Burkholderiales bacterium]